MNLSRFRRRRIRESLVEVAPDQPESRSVEASTEQADAVRQLLAGLSPRQRTVVGLRYCADLSEAEVAELLGVSVGTVKTLSSRGLAKLRAKARPGRPSGECPMSPDLDDEFGQRLGVLLAPPEVLQARPDAGSRLRARARTVARRRRGAALAVTGLLAFAVVTLAGYPRPADDRPATGRWSDAGWLTTPVEISTGTVVPGQQSCGSFGDLVRVGPDCIRVADSPLVIRQVAGIRVVARAAGAASLELRLVSANQGEVNQIVNADRDRPLVAFVYGTPRGAAVQSDRIVEITVGSVAEADELVTILGLRPDFNPRTGPGELDTPLTVRPVLRSTDPPCLGSSVKHDGRCLALGGPLVAVRSVQDITVLGPDRELTSVRIRVELPPAASATLGAYSATHHGQQIAFEVHGGLVGRTGPRIEGRLGPTIEILLGDQDEAEQVFHQLRP